MLWILTGSYVSLQLNPFSPLYSGVGVFCCLLHILGSILVQNPHPSNASLPCQFNFFIWFYKKKKVFFLVFLSLLKILKPLGIILYASYKAPRIISPTRLECSDFLCTDSHKPLSSGNSHAGWEALNKSTPCCMPQWFKQGSRVVRLALHCFLPQLGVM